MVLKDEKECYRCQKCHNEKEGKRLWCQLCWDEDECTKNYCLECVSHIGKQDHIIFNKTVNGHLKSIKFYEVLNSLNTLSILIFQLAQTVTCY